MNKTKFTLINNQTNGKEDFYVMNHKDEITILYKGKVYPTIEEGTIITWNGQNKVVNDKINMVDLGETKVIIIIGNKYASPDIKTENGYTVKFNRIQIFFFIATPHCRIVKNGSLIFCI